MGCDIGTKTFSDFVTVVVEAGRGGSDVGLRGCVVVVRTPLPVIVVVGAAGRLVEVTCGFVVDVLVGRGPEVGVGNSVVDVA